jgi:hypothetical protein
MHDSRLDPSFAFELEKRIATHDQAIAGLIDTIRQLMTPPENNKRPIGLWRLKRANPPNLIASEAANPMCNYVCSIAPLRARPTHLVD